MPGGLADLVDVERAHALLHATSRAARAAVASPRKYGLNGTMPALTNSRVGSSSSSDADGTGAWPRSVKKRRKRLRISAESIRVGPLGVSSGERCWAWARVPAVRRGGRRGRPGGSPSSSAARGLADRDARCGTPSRPPCSRWSRRGSRCRRGRARAPPRRPRSPLRAAYVPGGGADAEPDQAAHGSAPVLGCGVLLDLRPYLRGRRRGLGRGVAAERDPEPVEDVGVPRLGAVAGGDVVAAVAELRRARTAAPRRRPGRRAGRRSRRRGPRSPARE